MESKQKMKKAKKDKKRKSSSTEEDLSNEKVSADTPMSKDVEVSADAEDQYTQMVHSEMEKTVWKSGGCTSWYQSKSGHVIAMFPGFSFTFNRLASRFKTKHHLFRWDHQYEGF